jgi:hypothetical protein
MSGELTREVAISKVLFDLTRRVGAEKVTRTAGAAGVARLGHHGVTVEEIQAALLREVERHLGRRGRPC